MKKQILSIIALLIIQLINGQTITVYSTGYNSIEGIAINSNNEVFVSEHDTGKVYSVDSATGNQTEYASTGGFYANNIIFNTNDNLFITEPFLDKIFIKNSINDASVYVDISIKPNSFAIDSSGDLYFSSISKVVKINSDLSMTDYATGFLYAEGLAFDSNDNLYVADRSDRKLYKITPSGTRTVIASNIENIKGIAIDPNGKVYFTKDKAFPEEKKILKYDPTTNTVTDYITTDLNAPRHIAIDNLGNMYVTNRGNETIVKIHDTSLLNSTINIPDVNFKNALLNYSPIIDTNNDSEIQISEAVAVSELDVSFLSINDLTGIEEFINLTDLQCHNNQLSSLDVTNNINLTALKCNNNQLNSLDVSNNINLTSLQCYINPLSSLDVTNNTNLTDLFCLANQLSSLDVTNNTNLTSLVCSSNPLSSLDVTNNTNLTSLSCSSSQLSSLDVTNNINLTTLKCDLNQLSSLDVSNNTNLISLYCYNNQLSNLDVTNNTNLTDLHCYNNQLSSLDVSNNTNLNILDCSNNQLSNLDVSNNTNLIVFQCKNIFNLNYINLKNGNNDNLVINANYQSYFHNLPNLQTVCVDELNTDLTAYIEQETGHSVTFTTTCTLSVNENALLDFSVFPTPTENTLNITSKTEITKIEIYNKLGQLMIKIEKRNTIEISNLMQGLYFVKVEDVNGSFGVKKMMKK